MFVVGGVGFCIGDLVGVFVLCVGVECFEMLFGCGMFV